VSEDNPGKCPKCGMKLEKKQVQLAYVCPEQNCEYQRALPGECPEHKKELVKAELKTHCPKCGEQVNPEDLKLKPIKGGKDEKNN
jgi:ssDNA-binding Zn-finger/Zn-ribbon topoisomerase 1